MKNFLIILIISIFFMIGVNIGSGNNKSQAGIIQDKINDFETNIKDNNDINNRNIEPNILNKVANKCNNTVDSIINSVLRNIMN